MPVACPIRQRPAVNRGHSRLRRIGDDLRFSWSGEGVYDLCKQVVTPSLVQGC